MSRTYYELMDTDSGNVVGIYKTKDEALAIVRAGFERYGAAGVEDLALSENSELGDGNLLAEGTDLLRLASEAVLSGIAQ